MFQVMTVPVVSRGDRVISSWLCQVQRIFQIMEFKHKQEKLTGSKMVVSAVVTMHNSHVRVASSEPVSHSFVDSANVAWEAILRHGQLRDIVVAAEEHFGKNTPFDSVYKLECVARKADRDIDKITWELTGIIDLVLNQGARQGDFSIGSLTGKGRGNSNKGPHCQSYVLKHVVTLTSTNRELGTGYWSCCC